MASRNFHPIRGSLDRELVIVNFVIVLDNLGAVAAFKGKGVKSVTKTGVGEYEVVLQDAYSSYAAVQVSLAGVTSDVIPLIAGADVPNKSIIIATSDMVAQADTAVGATISVCAMLSNSSVY